MTSKKQIEIIVKEFSALCELNEFRKAGELARVNKDLFISIIKCGGISLSFAYEICGMFNMRQVDCLNLLS